MKQTLIVMALTAMLGSAERAAADHINHVSQASEHANMALDQSQHTGDTSALVQHDQEALTHLRMSLSEAPNPNLEKAAQTLEHSIESGQSGDSRQATQQTKEAIEYIDAARGALGG